MEFPMPTQNWNFTNAMPYNILPHDDRTQISDMDDVGLYTVDVWRNSSIEKAPNAPGSQSPEEAYAISLWLGGTQAVGETERGNLDIPYTNVDRLAYAMVGTFANIGYFSTSQYGIASQPVRVSQIKRPFVQFPVGESGEALDLIIRINMLQEEQPPPSFMIREQAMLSSLRMEARNNHYHRHDPTLTITK